MIAGKLFALPNAWQQVNFHGECRRILPPRSGYPFLRKDRLVRQFVDFDPLLRKDNINQGIIETLRSRLSDSDKKLLIEDAKGTSAWIYEVIRNVCIKDSL